MRAKGVLISVLDGDFALILLTFSTLSLEKRKSQSLWASLPSERTNSPVVYTVPRVLCVFAEWKNKMLLFGSCRPSCTHRPLLGSRPALQHSTAHPHPRFSLSSRLRCLHHAGAADELPLMCWCQTQSPPEASPGHVLRSVRPAPRGTPKYLLEV